MAHKIGPIMVKMLRISWWVSLFLNACALNHITPTLDLGLQPRLRLWHAAGVRLHIQL
jgi:hypothetical protein